MEVTRIPRPKQHKPSAIKMSSMPYLRIALESDAESSSSNVPAYFHVNDEEWNATTAFELGWDIAVKEKMQQKSDSTSNIFGSFKESDDSLTDYSPFDSDLPMTYVPQKNIKTVNVSAVPPLLTVLQQLGYEKPANDEEFVDSVAAADIPAYVDTVKENQLAQRKTLLLRYFIGCNTREQAALQVDMPTAFKIYYKLEKNFFELQQEVENDIEGNDRFLAESLPLYIVYFRSDFVVDHYKVKRMEAVDGKDLYQVQYGSEKAPKFRSVDRLLEYYHNNVAVRSTRYGIEDVDVFPYWKAKQLL